MIGNYTLLVFAFERAYVVFLPLRARGTARPKIFLSLLAAFYALSFAVNVIIPLSSVRSLSPGNSMYSCYPDPTNTVFFVVNFFVSSVFAYALPTVLLLAVNIVIVSGLIRASRSRRQLARGSDWQTTERSATATLLLVSLFQCAIYLPYSLVGLLYSLVASGLISINDAEATTSLMFSYFFLMDATVYTRLTNSFVYYMRIPFFHASVNAIFCFWKKRAADSSV